MKMEGWEDRLHSSFLGEHVLFGFLRLTSIKSFLFAAIFTVILCLFERTLTYVMLIQWDPESAQRSRFTRALWRTLLYWVVTLARLLYMLITMTFHVGLILVTVTSLAVGQFVIEYLGTPPHKNTNPRLSTDQTEEPLLSSRDYNSRTYISPAYEDTPVALDTIVTPIGSKPRAKPDDIFIHPTSSNLARADAYALQLGIGGRTERVHDIGFTTSDAVDAWEVGKGREVARELLGQSGKPSLFQIRDPDDEQDSSSDVSH